MARFILEEMREIARTIFLKSISSVDPYQRLKEYVHIDQDRLIIKEERFPEKVFDLNQFEKIYLLGTGKASCPMAQAVEELFGERITKGLIVTKYGHGLPLRFTEIIEAGHPLPDPNGMEGAKRIKEILNKTGPRDLIIFLLSGGGSSLLPLPANGITLKEKQESTPPNMWS